MLNNKEQLIDMFEKLLKIIPVFIFVTLSCSQTEESKPYDLMVSEGFKNPVGFYDANPTFSWKLPLSENVKSQSAFQIVVASDPELLPDNADLLNTGKVASSQSVNILYSGKPLSSRNIVHWQVMCWDHNGNPMEWSEVEHFELGLLNQDDWEAEWIRTPDPEKWDTTRFGTPLFRPQYLRNEFNTDAHIQKARLYVTARGVFHAFINGVKIGDDVLPPGWTPYQKRVETITYDVKEALQTGENAIGIILAEGWYAGRIGPQRRWDTLTAPPWAICQLEIEYANGMRQTIVTDKNWKGTTNGPIRSSGIYDGEVYDAHFEIPQWSYPGYDDGQWQQVKTHKLEELPQLLPKRHFTMRNKKELIPVAITKPTQAIALFDLGQNMVGVPRIRVPLKKGDTLIMRTGEMTNKDGSLYTGNLRGAPSTNYYIASRDGVVNWEPSFTYHGFRYVEMSGFNENAEPDKSWLTGIVQYTDFDQIGHFSTSHKKLNQLQSNILWGLKGNFIDVPIDCPQRAERLGWTGDAQVFAPTSLFLADVNAFWTAWLQSMREEQFPNGGLPVVVPNATGNFAQAGWSDAATIIPWQVYMYTGNTRVLEENFAMMQRWLDYHASQAENYISHMSTVGDWLQPYSNQPDERRGDTPHAIISTAFYGYSVQLTMKVAGVLGFKEDSVKLRELFNSICLAYENEFFDANGRIKEPYIETQTGYLLSIGLGLLSDTMTQKAIPHLVNQIKLAGNHLRTGFLGTPLLANVLDKSGHIDLLFEILFNETYPSWFYSINQGATTMWERWDGYTHDRGFARNQLSFNHYAYGAIGQWMYERIAGISPMEPGYKKIRIAPLPGGPLTFAKGEYDSPYGKIKSHWELQGNEFNLHITIPPNTTAQVVIPFMGDKHIVVDDKKITDRKDIEIISIDDNYMTIEIIPGRYNFISK